jgi:hypothetical protein
MVDTSMRYDERYESRVEVKGVISLIQNMGVCNLDRRCGTYNEP